MIVEWCLTSNAECLIRDEHKFKKCITIYINEGGMGKHEKRPWLQLRRYRKLVGTKKKKIFCSGHNTHTLSRNLNRVLNMQVKGDTQQTRQPLYFQRYFPYYNPPPIKFERGSNIRQLGICWATPEIRHNYSVCIISQIRTLLYWMVKMQLDRYNIKEYKTIAYLKN